MIAKTPVTLADTVLHPTSAKGRQQKLAWSVSGANAVVSASNALVLGSINSVNGATSSVNVGIGTATPGATLDVVGAPRPWISASTAPRTNFRATPFRISAAGFRSIFNAVVSG